jgi:hypothetical protein
MTWKTKLITIAASVAVVAAFALASGADTWW